MPEFYLVDREEDPGIIFLLEDGRMRPVYFHEERQLGAVAVFSSGPAYFVETNRNQIFQTDGLTESVVHSHGHYIRNVSFHPSSENYLLYSESYGAGRDGHIYRLNLQSGVAEIYRTVPIAEVGYWAGDFAFDPNGDLYISSGNRIPASIYTYDSGRFLERFSVHDPIMGFCFEDARTLYYTDHRNHLYKLDDFADRSIEYEGRADARLTDVERVELPDSETCHISGRLYGGEPFWPTTTVSARGPDLFWRQLEHARVHPNGHGVYQLEALIPGEYTVLPEIASEGLAAFLPAYQSASCGSINVDFCMSREGMGLDLQSLECNDAQEVRDEVYIVVDGERVWSSSLRSGHHRPVGRSFTFHEDHRIEIWEEDRFRDDRIGVWSLTYADAVALLRDREGPYDHRFHRDRGIVGDATYTLYFDIT